MKHTTLSRTRTSLLLAAAFALTLGAISVQAAPQRPPCNQNNTPGWNLMTPDERSAHRDALRGFKTVDQCKAYMGRHRDDMAARAKAKGVTLPTPRRDVCERMQARGVIK